MGKVLVSESRFVTPNVELKDQKLGKKIIIEYHLKDGVIPTISTLHKSCGCFKVAKENNRVVVNYQPKNIPLHLQSQGFYISRKSIRVEFDDNTFEILNFKVKIIA